MKFALLAAVVVAQEAVTDAPKEEPTTKDESTQTESTPILKKGGLGEPCDPNKADSGCTDPLRCAIKPVPNICVTKEACDLEVAGVKAECGATALAGGAVVRRTRRVSERWWAAAGAGRRRAGLRHTCL